MLCVMADVLSWELVGEVCGVLTSKSSETHTFLHPNEFSTTDFFLLAVRKQ